MNRTVVFVTFAVAVVAGVTSVTIIALIRPESTGLIVNTIVMLLTVLSGFALTTHGLIKVGDKVEKVEKQTNGTLSAKDKKIEELTAVILDLAKDK